MAWAILIVLVLILIFVFFACTELSDIKVLVGNIHYQQRSDIEEIKAKLEEIDKDIYQILTEYCRQHQNYDEEFL